MSAQKVSDIKISTFNKRKLMLFIKTANPLYSIIRENKFFIPQIYIPETIIDGRRIPSY